MMNERQALPFCIFFCKKSSSLSNAFSASKKINATFLSLCFSKYFKMSHTVLTLFSNFAPGGIDLQKPPLQEHWVKVSPVQFPFMERQEAPAEAICHGFEVLEHVLQQ